jgi:hypothetical protein
MAKKHKSKKQRPEHPKLRKVIVTDGLNNKIIIYSPGKFREKPGNDISLTISGSRFFNKEMDQAKIASKTSEYFDTFQDIFGK